MAIIEAKNYIYKYNGAEHPALNIPSLEIDEGELVVMIGPTGCGKTTLLRQIAGRCMDDGVGYRAEENGQLVVNCLSHGYVWQNPGAQFVCNRVGQEIVFAMENMGYDPDVMRRRLAEVVTFFGMEDLLHKDVRELSAGEQQMVNIAGAVALKPDILLLDEPAAALDPISAERLGNLILKIHDETGMTILIAEQRPDYILEKAGRVLVMERGEIRFSGNYRDLLIKSTLGGMADVNKDDIGNTTYENDKTIGDIALGYLRPSVRYVIGHGASVDIASDRSKLRGWVREHLPNDENTSIQSDMDNHGRNIFLMKDVYFRYERDSADVLRECGLTLHARCITALVGGNGSGKTTLAKLIAGYMKPYRGRIKTKPENISYLPSDPTYVSLEPVDGSGGEREWMAIETVMGQEADLYILDEPTKGLDPDTKSRLLNKLKQRSEEGKSVLVLTHDMEFAAEVSDEMAMMFDGRIVACGGTREFLKGNVYYTTELQRLLS